MRTLTSDHGRFNYTGMECISCILTLTTPISSDRVLKKFWEPILAHFGGQKRPVWTNQMLAPLLRTFTSAGQGTNYVCMEMTYDILTLT